MSDMHVVGEAPAVGGELQGAGVGRRFLATVVDVIVIGALAALWVSLFGESGSCEGAFYMSFNAGDDVRSVCGGMAGLYILLVVGSYVVLEKLLGATLGKLVLGLRVRSADGSDPSWGQTALRTVLRIIDGLLVYLVAAIAVWASPRNQRIGDMAARTLVVRARDLR